MTSASVEPAILVARTLSDAGFAHGFSTRAGGVSEGAYATANFGAGDDPARVAENVARFAASVGFDPAGLRQVTQVHGGRVVDGECLATAAAREEADALFLQTPRTLTPRPPLPREKGSEREAVTSERASAIGIRVADCVPVLLGSRTRGVAAIHAGWKGVVANVIGHALEALGEPGDAVAAIGPCIGACCFEVGGDVAERIAEATEEPRVVARRAGDKAFVDLRLAVRTQLAKYGVTSIEDVPGCTRCDATRFFSYRRDGAQSGRHLAAIVLP